MSKKTSAIYKCLDNLEELRKRMISCQNGENTSNELNDIDFHVQQELKTLRFWFDSLYKYNGRSTSLSKKNASIRNGMKGGRPPKEISITKKRIDLLKSEIIPDLDHKIVMADSNEELEELQKKRHEASEELETCENKVHLWIQNKNK